MTTVKIPVWLLAVAATIGGTSGTSFAQFTTIINVPPARAPSDRLLNSDTQLNLMDGGFLPGTVFTPFRVGLADESSTNVELNILGGRAGQIHANGGSVVNISGGTLDNGFIANSGSTVNISDGLIDNVGLFANSGSHVTISGGTIIQELIADSGSHVAISGGTFGPRFMALSSSSVALIGGEFQLNGTPVGDSTVTLPAGTGSVLSGTFEDGTPFIFSPVAGDVIEGVSLISAALPPVDTAPITVSGASAPVGLREGQTLTLLNGGELGPNFAAVNATMTLRGGETGRIEFAGTEVNVPRGGVLGRVSRAHAGSTVNVSGGRVGDGFSASGSEVNLTAGAIERGFAARFGSVVNVSGGFVDNNFAIESDTVVNISGGTVASGVLIRGGELNVSGGTVGVGTTGVLALAGSVVNLSGGTTIGLGASRGSEFTISGGNNFVTASEQSVGVLSGGRNSGFTAQPNSQITFVGGEFLVNGVAPTGSTVLLTESDVFTATLEDGSPFIAAPLATPVFIGTPAVVEVTLNHVPLAPADITPMVVASSTTLNGLRPGQSLELQAGGDLGDRFAVVEAMLNVDGGLVGDQLTVVGGLVSMSRGRIGNLLLLSRGSELEVSGGTVGASIGLETASTMTISGGAVGSNLAVHSDSRLTVSGGTVGGIVTSSGGAAQVLGGVVDELVANAGGVASVSGGVVGSLAAGSDGVVNVSGGRIGDILGINSGGIVSFSGGEIAAQILALSRSQLNLVGHEFLLDGIPIAGLNVPGDVVFVKQRGGARLSGRLADGSRFDLVLDDQFGGAGDFFASGSVVSLTLIPEPSALGLGISVGLALISCGRTGFFSLHGS